MIVAINDAEADHFGTLDKFPNYAPMNISAWHKAKGDKVVWFTPIESQFYDLVLDGTI